jgi:hypothetical protein
VSIFDLSVIADNGIDTVAINGPTVYALNKQVVGYPRDGYPIYFEVPGLKYHMVVSAWRDAVKIEQFAVDYRKDVAQGEGFTRTSTMHPRTQEEFLMALNTVGAIFEELHDSPTIYREAMERYGILIV